MDLKLYYQKIRDLERDFKADCAVVVSLETPDGGKAGVQTEVPARTAAKMIVEGRARPASAEEDRKFQEQKLEAKHVADELDMSRQMQIRVVSDGDRRAVKSGKSLAKQ